VFSGCVRERRRPWDGRAHGGGWDVDEYIHAPERRQWTFSPSGDGAAGMRRHKGRATLERCCGTARTPSPGRRNRTPAASARMAPLQVACAGHGCCTILHACRNAPPPSSRPGHRVRFPRVNTCIAEIPARQHRTKACITRFRRARDRRFPLARGRRETAPRPTRLATNFHRTPRRRLHHSAPAAPLCTAPGYAGARPRGTHPTHPHHGGRTCR